MLHESSFTTVQVLDVFTEEITARGGRVTDTFHDGRRLFTRSILPAVEEVQPRDRVQGGVALKATEERVWLYPYLFRQVCRNGAIFAESLESRMLCDLHLLESVDALDSVRETIEFCCAQEVFMHTIRKMRSACNWQVDMALNLLPMLSQLSSANLGVLTQIMEQFFREGDHSQFGLANAVTSVARDTQDPDLRWNLEEFGGGVFAGTLPRQPIDGGRAAIELFDAECAVV